MSTPKTPTAVILTGHSVTAIAALSTVGVVTLAATVGAIGVIVYVKYQDKKLKKNAQK